MQHKPFTPEVWTWAISILSSIIWLQELVTGNSETRVQVLTPYESLHKFLFFFFLWALTYFNSRQHKPIDSLLGMVELMTPGDENKVWWEHSPFHRLKWKENEVNDLNSKWPKACGLHASVLRQNQTIIRDLESFRAAASSSLHSRHQSALIELEFHLQNISHLWSHLAGYICIDRW